MSEFTPVSVTQILICLIAVVLGSIVLISFGVYVPHFVEEFDAKVGAVSAAASAALLVSGLVSPFVGRVIDIYPIRTVLLTGVIILLGGLAAISFSANVPQLLLCYVAMGVAHAVVGPVTAVKHMTVWFPNNLGVATALVVLPLGAIFYPPLTNWLVDSFGWRESFRVYAVAALVVMGLVLFIKASPDVPVPVNVDESASSDVEESVSNLTSWEIYRSLLLSGMFYFAIFAFCCFISTQLSALTHFVVVAQSKGLSVDDGVTFLTMMGIASLIGGPLSGVIADRLGPKAGYVLVGVVQSAALMLLTFQSSYLALATVAVVLGFFLSAIYVFFVAYVTKVIGRPNFGTGFGLATLIWSIICAFPPTIAGFIYDAFGSYDWHFGVLAALTFTSGLLAWLLSPPTEVEYATGR